MIVMVHVPEEALRAPVPQHALTLSDVNTALGSVELVKQLRKIGVLMPAVKLKQTLLFDAGDVARVWAEVRAGKYAEQLAALG